METFAAAFRHGWQAQGAVKPLHLLECALYRPAEAGAFQHIMTMLFYDDRNSHTGQTFDYYDPSGVFRWWDDYGIPDGYMVLPEHKQRVTVTGSWCCRLPDAMWSLLGAHYGVIPHGRVYGDRFIAPCIEPDPDTGFDDESAYEFWLYENALDEERQCLKPYTCEYDRHPCWYYY